jgi:ABC-type multidrug transport system ATPase subunit
VGSEKGAVKVSSVLATRLVIEHVALTWNHRAPPLLCGLDLVADSGRVTVLCGPNGSGKSSLLHGLSARAAPFIVAGRVLWGPFGQALPWTKTEAQARSLLLQQAAPFFATDRVSSYFRLFGEVSGFNQDRLDKLIEKFAVSDLLNKPLAQLSGGQWRRVQCAAHFAVHAPVRLLDEPEAGLDRKAVVALMDELDCSRQRGEIVLLATHSQRVIERVANWVCYLDSGACRWSSSADLFVRYGPKLG